MFDAECPFCRTGFNLEEPLFGDETLEMECPSCMREVVVSCKCVFVHEVHCAPEDHFLVEDGQYPGFSRCTICDWFGVVPPEEQHDCGEGP